MFGAINAARKRHQESGKYREDRPLRRLPSLSQFVDLSQLFDKVYTQGRQISEGVQVILHEEAFRGEPFRLSVLLEWDRLEPLGDSPRAELFLVYSIERYERGVLVEKREFLTSERFDLAKYCEQEYTLFDMHCCLQHDYPLSCEFNSFKCRYYCVFELGDSKDRAVHLTPFNLYAHPARAVPEGNCLLFCQKYSLRQACCLEQGVFELELRSPKGRVFSSEEDNELTLSCYCNSALEGQLAVRFKRRLQQSVFSKQRVVEEELLLERVVSFRARDKTTLRVRKGELQCGPVDDNQSFSLFCYLECEARVPGLLKTAVPLDQQSLLRIFIQDSSQW